MQPQQCNLLYPKYHSKVSIWHFGISMLDLKLRCKSPNFALEFPIFILDSFIPRWKLHTKSNLESVWYMGVRRTTSPAVFKPQFVQCHTKKPEQSNRHTCSGFPLVIIIAFAELFSCLISLLPQSSRSQEIAPHHLAHRAEAPKSNGAYSYDTPARHRQPHRMSRTSRSVAWDWQRRWSHHCQIQTCAVRPSSLSHTTCGYPRASTPPFQNPRQTDSPARWRMNKNNI